MADRLLGNAPAPIKFPVIDQKTGLLTQPWQDYFNRMSPTLDAIPSRLNSVSLSGQSGNLSATDFSNGVLLVGQYRLTYYTRLISPGGGSLTVTFRWTDGGVSCSFEGQTLTLGAAETSGTMSQSTLVNVDKGSPITYETAATGGVTYNLGVTLEKMAVL